MMNENAISNVLIDVDFLEEELRRIDRGHLCTVFVELRSVSSGACVLLKSLSTSVDHSHSVDKHGPGLFGSCEPADVLSVR